MTLAHLPKNTKDREIGVKYLKHDKIVIWSGKIIFILMFIILFISLKL